jgi:hypothetical protein
VSTGGEKQLIVVLPVLSGGIQVPDENLLLCRVDSSDLMSDLHGNIVFIAKDLRGPGYEGLFFVDQSGDVVGDASGGIGCMRAGFENNDFRFGLSFANL